MSKIIGADADSRATKIRKAGQERALNVAPTLCAGTFDFEHTFERYKFAAQNISFAADSGSFVEFYWSNFYNNGSWSSLNATTNFAVNGSVFSYNADGSSLTASAVFKFLVN